MHSIVVVREVWDTRDLTGDMVDGAGAIRTDRLTTRFEPEDLNALEMALRIKDTLGGQVTVLALGAPGEVDVLRECLYRGADRAVRVPADLADLDTAGRARLLAQATQAQDGWRLVLAGVTIPEGETSLLGSHLAAELGVEQASYVDSLESVTETEVVARRAIEMGIEDIRLPLPAVVSVGVALLADDPRTPRSAKAMLKLKAKKAEIPEFAAAGGPSPTRRTGHQAVSERQIESQDVDPNDEAALQGMLQRVLKGEG